MHLSCRAICSVLKEERYSVIGCVERILFIVYTEWGNDIYKVSVKKTSVSLRIDNDVLMALKDMGKGYQTRINNILRKAVFG